MMISMQWRRRVLALLLSLCLHGCSSHRRYHRTEAFSSTPAPISVSIRRRRRSENVSVLSGRATVATSFFLTTKRRKQTEHCSSSRHDDGGDDGGSDDEELLNQKLLHIARNLKLNVLTDAVTGDEILSFQSQDSRYAIEVIQTQISISNGQGLGLVLTEMASTASAANNNGGGQRGLVLVSEVSGNAQQAEPKAICVGDVITSVRTTTATNKNNNDSRVGGVRRTAGLNYDGTVQAIGEVKEQATVADDVLVLELNRLVERAPIHVEIVSVDEGKTMRVKRTIDALAGENLRQLLMRKADTTLGVCGGEGTCGSCLVKVHDGVEYLGSTVVDTSRRKDNNDDGEENDDHESIIEGNDQSSSSMLRKACQTTLGANNRPGTVRIEL